MNSTVAHSARWKTLVAFAIIYFVWGSTFLAIRIGVEEVPPFLLASMRFVAAGLVLYLWMLLKGERNPTAKEWGSVTLVAALIFACAYGLVFWAEQRVPSGLTAVMQSTIPALMALSEILILRTQKLTVRSLNLGGAPIDHAGAVALICAATCWSVASALSRKLPLPQVKTMSSGAQMLVGGVLLALVAAVRGEFAEFHPAAVSAKAWLSLLYLIVA